VQLITFTLLIKNTRYCSH